jgi:hypothetical protein
MEAGYLFVIESDEEIPPFLETTLYYTFLGGLLYNLYKKKHIISDEE